MLTSSCVEAVARALVACMDAAGKGPSSSEPVDLVTPSLSTQAEAEIGTVTSHPDLKVPQRALTFRSALMAS